MLSLSGFNYLQVDTRYVKLSTEKRSKQIEDNVKSLRIKSCKVTTQPSKIPPSTEAEND